MRSLRLGIALAALALPKLARACVVCDSEVGHSVRAGIFDGHFLHGMLVTAAPFAVFLAIAWLIYLRFPIPEDLDAASSDGMTKVAHATGQA